MRFDGSVSVDSSDDGGKDEISLAYRCHWAGGKVYVRGDVSRCSFKDPSLDVRNAPLDRRFFDVRLLETKIILFYGGGGEDDGGRESCVKREREGGREERRKGEKKRKKE